MIGGFALLLMAQFLGEIIASVLNLPVPGQVIGLVLLLVTMLVSRGQGKDICAICPGLEEASQGLLKYLALLFVPAGTGVVAYFALIRQEWLAITVALVGSTVIAIAVTAFAMRAMIRRRGGPQPTEGAPKGDATSEENRP
jgi:holin-like protein